MNRDDIIRMAREQGCPETATDGVFLVNADDLGRLLAAEREACAQFLESTNLGGLPDATALHYARLLKGFAEGIRARGAE
jgi:hypothetical protein